MLLSLLHRTTFVYSGTARESFNEVRLKPVNDASQKCRSFRLSTTPGTDPIDYEDFYGNTVHYFDIPGVHERLVVEAVSQVETTPDADRKPVPAVPLESLKVNAVHETYAEYITNSHYVPLDPALWREAQDALAGGRTDVWADAKAISRHIYRTFTYRPGTTGVSTLATDALAQRCGVCQDFAHVALALCRCSGIPARYVSGYFLNPFLKPTDEEASHAWVEILVPGYGWAGLDPTHDRPADQRYIKVASGRDYGDIRPVSGTYLGSPTRVLAVDVRVREMAAPPPEGAAPGDRTAATLQPGAAPAVGAAAARAATGDSSAPDGPGPSGPSKTAGATSVKEGAPSKADLSPKEPAPGDHPKPQGAPGGQGGKSC